MLAFRTTFAGITSLVAASTRGKAIARTLLSAAEAGFDVRRKWKEVRAVRAPEYDEWAKSVRVGCWDEGVVKGATDISSVALLHSSTTV